MVDAVAYVDARVWGGPRRAEALLAVGGTIETVGSSRQVLRARPTGTVVRRAEGRLIIPGLIDPHLHLAETVVAPTMIDVRAARSTRALQRRLAVAAEEGDGVVLGGGWDQEQFTDRRWPTRRDLDAVVRDRAVALYRVCRHAAVVNSAMLAQLGVDRDTPDPPGGRIGRDDDGGPNGLLFERAVGPLRRFAVERFAKDPAGQRAFSRHANRTGLTAVGAMSVGFEELAVLRPTGRRAVAMPRIRAYLRVDAASGRFPRRGSRGPAPVVGVKAIIDGSFGSQTAALDRPYSDRPGERGVSYWTDSALEPVLRRARAAGLTPALHAIGDAALRQAIGSLRRTGSGPSRVEHASLVPPALLGPLGRLNGTVVVQPRFPHSDTWLPSRLGARCRHAYRFRTMIAAGIRLAGSSDSPVEPMDPWTGLKAAVERPDAPAEALDADQALGMYTHGAARALDAPELGRLAPGAAADFVVLDARDVGAAIQRGSLVVRETWRAGRCVHRRRPNR